MTKKHKHGSFLTLATAKSIKNSFHPQSQYNRTSYSKFFSCYFAVYREFCKDLLEALTYFDELQSVMNKTAFLRWGLVIVSFWNTLTITLFMVAPLPPTSIPQLCVKGQMEKLRN